MKAVSLMVVFVFLFGFLCVMSWAYNIYKFVSLDFEAPYKAEVLRGVGIPVAPVGVVLGFVEFDEEKE